jgi:hypothetical protein
MNHLIQRRAHQLADTLAELKTKVRTAVATELAGAVGAAVRDVLVVALVDRLIAPPRPAPPVPRAGGWRDDESDRDRDGWGEARDPWGERDGYADPERGGYERPARADCDDRASDRPTPGAAVAVGVSVGRWWLARTGSVAGALGAGALATTLGLGGGPLARAALAVLSAAADVLTAEAALGRTDPS